MYNGYRFGKLTKGKFLNIKDQRKLLKDIGVD